MDHSNVGYVLSVSLGRARGQTISGQPVTATKTGGVIRMTDSTETPLRLLVEGPVVAGGQAAVAKCKTVPVPWYSTRRPAGHSDPPEGATVALRVEFFNGDYADLRRSAVTMAGVLSRMDPQRYPALVRVHQTFRTRVGGLDVMCDVAEWCSSLYDHMARHRDGLPEANAIALWMPVAETMNRLYEDHKWVHRDIDEMNILVSSDGSLRISDLGIVSTLPIQATHKYTRAAGKNLNFPPEGRAAFDEQKTLTVRPSYDAWQLGRILLILLTGNRGAVLENWNAADFGLTAQPTAWGTATSARTLRTLGGLLDHDPTTRWTLTQAIEALRPPTEPVQIAVRAHQDEIDRLRMTPAARTGVVRARQLDYIARVLEIESQPPPPDRSPNNIWGKDESLSVTNKNLFAWRKNSTRSLGDIPATGWAKIVSTLPLLAALCVVSAGILGNVLAWRAHSHVPPTLGVLGLLAFFAGSPSAFFLMSSWTDLWDQGDLKPWGSADLCGSGHGAGGSFSTAKFFESGEFHRTPSWWAAWFPPLLIAGFSVIVGFWLGGYVVGATELTAGTDQWLYDSIGWLFKKESCS